MTTRSAGLIKSINACSYKKEHAETGNWQDDEQLDMRRLQITRWSRPSSRTNSTSSISKLPIIQIQNATFYRRYPSPKEEIPSLNPPLFSNLTFSLPSFTLDPQNWAIVGGSSTGKTTFLEILRGEHICIPPASRAFPFLSSLDDQKQNAGYRSPSRAIHYVGFTGEGGGKERLGTRGSYLSARYESHREESDITVLNYLLGNTELNPLYREEIERKNDDRNDFDKVVEDLRLGPFIHMSLGNLSNGQTRRARIAKALLGKPEILLLDQPFSMILSRILSNGELITDIIPKWAWIRQL